MSSQDARHGKTTLLLLGGTGHVGRHALALALSDPRIGCVIAPVRRALPPHPKLRAPVVSNFETLDENASWLRVDAVVCALGTTLRAAGSKDQFRKVDHEYPLAAAKYAHLQGAPAFVLNSATGSNRTSRFFYNRVKAELEDDLSALGFESLTFVRPGVIGGVREEFRLIEQALVMALRIAGPVLPRRLRLNPPQAIARQLLDAAVNRAPGIHIVTADQMV